MDKKRIPFCTFNCTLYLEENIDDVISLYNSDKNSDLFLNFYLIT